MQGIPVFSLPLSFCFRGFLCGEGPGTFFGKNFVFTGIYLYD